MGREHAPAALRDAGLCAGGGCTGAGGGAAGIGGGAEQRSASPGKQAAALQLLQAWYGLGAPPSHGWRSRRSSSSFLTQYCTQTSA